MSSLSIARRIDVVSHVDHRQLAAYEHVSSEARHFQPVEERPSISTIQEVSNADHLRQETMGSAEVPPVIAAGLRALIQVEHGVAWSRPRLRRQHDLECEITMDERTCSPPDDYVKQQIREGGQVQLGQAGADFGNVHDPWRVETAQGELPRQNVRNLDRGRDGRPPEPLIAMKRAATVFPHQESN